MKLNDVEDLESVFLSMVRDSGTDLNVYATEQFDLECFDFCRLTDFIFRVEDFRFKISFKFFVPKGSSLSYFKIQDGSCKNLVLSHLVPWEKVENDSDFIFRKRLLDMFLDFKSLVSKNLENMNPEIMSILYKINCSHYLVLNYLGPLNERNVLQKANFDVIDGDFRVNFEMRLGAQKLKAYFLNSQNKFISLPLAILKEEKFFKSTSFRSIVLSDSSHFLNLLNNWTSD